MEQQTTKLQVASTANSEVPKLPHRSEFRMGNGFLLEVCRLTDFPETSFVVLGTPFQEGR
eukprot:2818207-Alexandrium_andersonii.AAC.1